MELSSHVTVGVDDSSPYLLLRASAAPLTVARGDLQPEKRLMFAVLEEAIRALTQREIAGSCRRRRSIQEATAWFADDDRSWPFSFVNICDALGLDVARLRRRLVRLQAVARLRGMRGRQR